LSGGLHEKGVLETWHFGNIKAFLKTGEIKIFYRDGTDYRREGGRGEEKERNEKKRRRKKGSSDRHSISNS